MHQLHSQPCGPRPPQVRGGGAEDHHQQHPRSARGGPYWSLCDALSGYYQVGLHEDTIPLTGFITESGMWEWVVLPMGLKNAGCTFQLMMDRALLPLHTGGGPLRGLNDTTLPAQPRGSDGTDHQDDIDRVAKCRKSASRAYIDDLCTGSVSTHSRVANFESISFSDDQIIDCISTFREWR